MATNTTRAMWKRKNLTRYVMPKVHNLPMSPITSEIEDTLQNLPKDIRDEYIMAFKNKRNNQNHNNYQGNNKSNMEKQRGKI
jgi:hypothetical protein